MCPYSCNKDTSTYKGFRPTFAASFSYYLVFVRVRVPSFQDSSKGGAVETGCSGSHYLIGSFIT